MQSRLQPRLPFLPNFYSLAKKRRLTSLSPFYLGPANMELSRIPPFLRSFYTQTPVVQKSTSEGSPLSLLGHTYTHELPDAEEEEEENGEKEKTAAVGNKKKELSPFIEGEKEEESRIGRKCLNGRWDKKSFAVLYSTYTLRFLLHVGIQSTFSSLTMLLFLNPQSLLLRPPSRCQIMGQAFLSSSSFYRFVVIANFAFPPFQKASSGVSEAIANLSLSPAPSFQCMPEGRKTIN